jgi:hypothetical protein
MLLSKIQRPMEEQQAISILNNKTRFCAFIVTHCWDERYKDNGIMIWSIFFDLLSEAAAKNKVNTPSFPAVKSFGQCRKRDLTDAVVNVFSSFRFSLVFDNRAIPGYVTEKITNALVEDTIPIYWGAPDIFEYVIVDRIVHCGELESSVGLGKFRAVPKPENISQAELIMQTLGPQLLRDAMQPCINGVLELEQDPKKYLWKLSQPILPNGAHFEGSYFDLRFIAQNVQKVMAAYNSLLVLTDGMRH